MSKKTKKIFAAFTVLFLILAPLSFDFYNSLNMRAFLNTLANSGRVIPQELVVYQNHAWKLDWPYPPITILVIYPAWFFYNFLGNNEYIFQLLLKFPLYLACLYLGNLIYKKTKKKIYLTAFLFNPAVILLSLVWGGFELLNSLLIVLAVSNFLKNKLDISAFYLSFAIALRIYPVILLPLITIFLLKREVKLAIRYFLIALSTTFFSFISGLALGKEFFASAILRGQTSLGPFGIYPIIKSLEVMSQFTGHAYFSVSSAVSLLFLILAVSELLLLINVWKGKISLIDSSIISLLLFFLFYPKVHGLYILVLLPFSYLYKKWKNIYYLWLPGFVWVALVNGFENIRGLSYWFYWKTNFVFSFQEITNQGLTVLLSFFQEIAILYIILSFINVKILTANK